MNLKLGTRAIAIFVVGSMLIQGQKAARWCGGSGSRLGLNGCLPFRHQVNHRFSRRSIGRQGNRVNIAHSHQRRNIRLVWLSRQRIAEEEHGLDFPFRDATANDQVAALGPVCNSFNFEAEFFLQQLTGIAGGYELLLAKEVDVAAREFE